MGTRQSDQCHTFGYKLENPVIVLRKYGESPEEALKKLWESPEKVENKS